MEDKGEGIIKKDTGGEVKSIKLEKEGQPSNFCSYGVCNVMEEQGKKKVKLPHWLHNQMKGWIKSSPRSHPSINVNVRLCSDGYGAAGIKMPATHRQAPYRGLTDTGAMTTCAGMGMMRAIGLT